MELCTSMQLILNFTLLRFLFNYLSHMLIWVDNRASLLFTCILQCVSIHFPWEGQISQKATGHFVGCTAAKIRKVSYYCLRILINCIISCFHTQVFCCLGRCLVGFWKGYFNRKRCRRRNIIPICFQECRFCRTFSILIKIILNLIKPCFSMFPRMKPCLSMDYF